MDELLVLNGGNNPTESVQLDAAFNGKTTRRQFLVYSSIYSPTDEK